MSVFVKLVISTISLLMLSVAVSILGGQGGWEEDFDPPLTSREKQLVRIGVLFEHGFQIGFFGLAFAVVNLGESKAMRTLAATAVMLQLGLT